jgi:hypothetical protein
VVRAAPGTGSAICRGIASAWRSRRLIMNGWQIFGWVVLAIVVLLVLLNIKDLLRYIRIRSM